MYLALIVIAAFAWYVMTPAERERLVRGIARVVPKVKGAAILFRCDRDELLEQMLRDRTPWPMMTPIIATLNIALYIWSQSDVPVAEMFGNFGPRTTNGEWWRLVTSMFVHGSAFHLALNMIALVQVGLVVERLVGSLTFASVYLVTGMFASLLGLSGSQAAVITGSSGAVFGIYGLVVASWMWGTFQHADSTIRLRTIKGLAPVAAIFAGFNFASGDMPTPAECLGLVTGFACGVLMARSVRVCKPPVRRIATTVAASAYIALMASVPLRGVSDVRPAVAQVLSVEERTVAMYDAALEEFRNGRLDKKELAQFIEQKIITELLLTRLELQSLGKTPREHQPIVQAAQIYALRRIESWKARAQAVRAGDARALRNADMVERAAVQMLDRLR